MKKGEKLNYLILKAPTWKERFRLGFEILSFGKVKIVVPTDKWKKEIDKLNQPKEVGK